MKWIVLYFLPGISAIWGLERQTQQQNIVSSLERIFQNDELKCIPRLICEQAAGGKPGQARSILIDTSSLFTLLQYVGVEASPMMELGRAILTGLSNRGDSYPCYKQYPSCPRDEARLLHYLNNHKGGFFRGFSRPYARSESRIVNKAFENNLLVASYAPGNVKDFGEQNGFFPENVRFFPNDQSKYHSFDFTFPERKGKKIHFKPVEPTDRLPSSGVGYLVAGNRFFPE